MEQIEVQWSGWTVLFSVTAVQSFFLALVFFTVKAENRQANRLMGAFMLCFAISMSDYVGFWTNFHYTFPYFADIYKIAGFCFGPLLLLYFKASERSQTRISNFDWLHLLPAVLVLLLRIPFYFFSYETQMTIVRASVPRSTDPFMWFWLRIHWSFAKFIMYHMILYIPIIWVYLRSRKKKHDVSKLNGSGLIQKRWYNTLFLLYIGYVMGYVLYYLLLITGNYALLYDYSISLAMTVFVFVVGFLGYQQPKIFTGEMLQQVFLSSKYQSSTMTAQAADSLLQKLLDHMEAHKPHRNNELRLTTLAEALDVPSYHLSQTINQKLDQSFAHFINHYRLKDVQIMLSDPDYDDLPILQIAYEAGFNNRTTFYKAFKKHFGVLPTEYRQLANGKEKS